MFLCKVLVLFFKLLLIFNKTDSKLNLLLVFFKVNSSFFNSLFVIDLQKLLFVSKE